MPDRVRYGRSNLFRGQFGFRSVPAPQRGLDHGRNLWLAVRGIAFLQQGLSPIAQSRGRNLSCWNLAELRENGAASDRFDVGWTVFGNRRSEQVVADDVILDLAQGLDRLNRQLGLGRF